jgi:hypothetical protein
MLHTSGHFAGFISGSSPAATVEGARRSLYNPYIASSAVRPPGSC